MSNIKHETTGIDRFSEITSKIQALKAERAKINKDLRSAGIEADEQIEADLSNAAQEARQKLADLDRQIHEAQARQAALEAALDRGEGSQEDDLELFSAGTAVRRLRGTRKSVEAESRKAQRAVELFSADDHLALLAADTLGDLVDVPVLARKRVGDVRGITDAVVLSQVEPTEDYGTFKPSGCVRFTELGTTGLDLEALETALRDTGSDVRVHSGLIDFEVALWPVPRLKHPSQDGVGEFARVLASVFQKTVEGPTTNRGYSNYSTLWETTEASLEVVEPGGTKGKVVANVGIERERPPLFQMRQFIDKALSHFEAGVHTSAGLLDEISVVEVLDAGLWVADGEPFIHNRDYPARFLVTIELDYSYFPVEV